MSATSIVTPSTTNGHSAPVAPKGKARKAAALATVSAPAIATAKGMTVEQAVNAAFEYGQSMAGLDGTLVKALVAYKGNDSVRADMLTALNVGYFMRKLGYDRAKATETVGLLKYNEKKQDDHHRTFEQERVMVAVRVLWSRANAMAGTSPEKTDGQVKAEATRAAKEAEKEAHEARLIKADELINPKDDVDPFESLTRLVSTMRSLQNKYSAKLTGDRGSAWRDWLANAPK